MVWYDIIRSVVGCGIIRGLVWAMLCVVIRSVIWCSIVRHDKKCSMVRIMGLHCTMRFPGIYSTLYDQICCVVWYSTSFNKSGIV